MMCQTFVIAPVKENRLLDFQVSGKWKLKTYAQYASVDVVGS